MSNLFTRKETNFFDLFEIGISYSCQAAEKLKCSFKDGVINQNEIKSLKDIEHEADKHVHRSLKLIEEAFITPIDRSDILEIVKQIENITDSIDDVSNHLYMMCVNTVDETSIKFIDLAVDACNKLQQLMKLLKNFKKNAKQINVLVVEVNQIEEIGDKLYSNAMRKLYETNKDPIKMIIWNDLYTRMEEVLDRCEDVADIVNKILITKT